MRSYCQNCLQDVGFVSSTVGSLTGASVAFEKSPSWALLQSPQWQVQDNFCCHFVFKIYAFSSERRGVSSLLYCCYGGYGWENESNYVSFNLPVNIHHPFSFDVTQLFSQMDFKFLSHI
jgi:hypothetical protein